MNILIYQLEHFKKKIQKTFGNKGFFSLYVLIFIQFLKPLKHDVAEKINKLLFYLLLICKIKIDILINIKSATMYFNRNQQLIDTQVCFALLLSVSTAIFSLTAVKTSNAALLICWRMLK